jgi:hypothetical protein
MDNLTTTNSAFTILRKCHGTALRDWDSDWWDNYTDRWDDYSDEWP